MMQNGLLLKTSERQSSIRLNKHVTEGEMRHTNYNSEWVSRAPDTMMDGVEGMKVSRKKGVDGNRCLPLESRIEEGWW